MYIYIYIISGTSESFETKHSTMVYHYEPECFVDIFFIAVLKVRATVRVEIFREYLPN